MNKTLKDLLEGTMSVTKKDKTKRWCNSDAYWAVLLAVCYAETHDVTEAAEESKKLHRQLRACGAIDMWNPEKGKWVVFYNTGVDLLSVKLYIQNERPD